MFIFTQKDAIEALLGTLTEKEQLIIKMRFGLSEFQPHTLKNIGQYIGRSIETIRQGEARALHKLRHPTRWRDIKEFLTIE